MKRWKWPVVWLTQIALMLAAGTLAALMQLLGAAVSGVAMWVVMPLAGAISAYRATRGGLLNYAAWIAPPVCMTASHWMIWDYLPHAGSMMLCAFVSLVGAAAGEVMNREIQRGNMRKQS